MTRRRVAAALALALLATACFDLEAPVEERLLFAFLPEGGLRVRLSVELRREGEKAALESRLQQLEGELLSGMDPWPRRFAEPEAALESFYWEKEEERLVYVERNLVLDDPEALAALLADSAIQPAYRVDDGVAELALFPGPPSGATRRERREMKEELAKWSRHLAAYFSAGEALYRHLDAFPHRAVPCFGEIFDDDEDWGELTAEEEALLDAFGEASGEILSVLDVDVDRGYSLDELSRRVYDPFPALISVELPSPAVEVEGFAGAERRWQVPGLSLWASLAMLEGVWLEPDPVMAWVEHERSASGSRFDVRGFAARGRTAASPDEREVREALEEGLRPADVYRASWRVE